MTGSPRPDRAAAAPRADDLAALDPWSSDDAYFERRRDAFATAMLPASRYERCLEPGSTVGELTRRLAARCGEVVAADATVAGLEHVQWRVRMLDTGDAAPGTHVVAVHLPPGTFDLVVLLDVGNYIGLDDTAAFVSVMRRCLAPGATVLAGHGVRSRFDHPHVDEALHREISAVFGTSLVAHRDDDLVIDVWRLDV